MTTDNKTQGLSATQKISLVAGTLPVLYLLPGDANAAIIFNDNSFFASYGGPISVEWDVDGDGNNDFILEATSSDGSSSYIYLNSNGGRNGRGFARSTTADQDVIKNLASGFVVGPTLAAGYSFGPSGQDNRTLLTYTSTVGFNWQGGVFGSNFVGFGFETGAGDTLYGWAEVVLSANTVTIERWAYNNTPGGSIRVGQTQDDTPVTTPEHSSPLALLAMGAAGVYRWRKNRKSAQIEEDKAA